MNMDFEKFDEEKQPKSRIELHIHLEGSIRSNTIWEVAKEKGYDLGVKTLEELNDILIAKTPGTLASFLKRIELYMPLFKGDLIAMERIAYELCEDQAKQGVLYFEVRYSPHGCTNTYSCQESQCVPTDDPNDVTPKMVVQSVNRGLRRGEVDFNIKARVILCCLVPFPEWNEAVLNLCQEFKGNGVVGIDIAGDESHDTTPEPVKEKLVYEIFKKAAKLGVHRTVHAGEAGSSKNVEIAINKMNTERVGHGYRVLQDLNVYKQVLDKNIHLECCPHSSILTGSVPITTNKHPIVKFAEDNANFSISKDDPSITGTTLDSEYEMLRKMGLREVHFIKANLNAAKSCFLPNDEKNELIAQLYKEYGIEMAKVAITG